MHLLYAIPLCIRTFYNHRNFYTPLDISKNTQTLIQTIFSGAIATYEDS
ncbi:MAG: hypothetical protein O4860_07565 [Trichodesmium sp. St2_bin2_1]|nr:hypothetical protein [Trichodesmium sp. St2_bin2_1]